MKSNIVIVALASFTLFLGACGSSSGSQSNPELQTQDEGDISTFCMQNQQDPSCQRDFQNAMDNGFTPYNGNVSPSFCNQSGFDNSNWGQSNNNTCNNQQPWGQNDNGFAGAGGFCGCDWGLQPVVVNGHLMCAETQSQSVNGRIITFEGHWRAKTKKNGKRKVISDTHLSFDLVKGQQSQTRLSPASGSNCYQQVQMGCVVNDPYACQDVSNNGHPVQSYCAPVPGQQYGQCVYQ